MGSRQEKMPPLNEGLLTALQALESQMSRELQRTPQEQSLKGVSKEEPMNRRVESLASFVVETIGSEQASIESCLIIARSFTKAAYILADELGHKGLGAVRATYTENALEKISDDALKGSKALRNEREVM